MAAEPRQLSVQQVHRCYSAPNHFIKQFLYLAHTAAYVLLSKPEDLHRDNLALTHMYACMLQSKTVRELVIASTCNRRYCLGVLHQTFWCHYRSLFPMYGYHNSIPSHIVSRNSLYIWTCCSASVQVSKVVTEQL